jgi:hypothetical protein
MSTTDRAQAAKGRAKHSYKTPALTVYGSVRELTGAGSGTMNGDAGNMMA